MRGGPFVSVTLAVLACSLSPVWGEEDWLSRGRWNLEEVVLENGDTWQGLIRSSEEGQEFVHVVQPLGKPMYLVIRPLPVRRVAAMRRLPEKERLALAQRVEAFQRRPPSGQDENLVLRYVFENDLPLLAFQGRGFRLLSSLDEELTRRCVMRIQRIFAAYRQLLPPTAASEEVAEPQDRPPLTLLLLGSMEDYRNWQERAGFQFRNAAFFWSKRNRIVAGADLELFARRLAIAMEKHEEIAAACRRLDQQLPMTLAVHSQQLKEAGVSRDRIEEELLLIRAQWERQRRAKILEIKRADQHNDQEFARVTRELFARLHHEAWHAYLANRPGANAQTEPPRWLNEGLAQVFETAQLDGDSLRIDAPDPDRLARLQRLLRGDNPVPLGVLLESGAAEFAVHGADREASDARYLTAWGLTWWLLFEHDRGQAATVALLRGANSAKTPAERLEAATGAKLRDLESAWRRDMLALRPRR